MQVLTGLGKKPAALMFSPDGRYLAGGDARAHHVWDLSAGPSPLWSARHPQTNERTFCFAPDGLSVVGRWNDRTFRRYDVRTGKGGDDPALTALNPFLFSPDGRLAVGWGGRVEGADWVCCARFAAGKWAEVWRKDFHYDEEEGTGGYELLTFSADSGRLARVFRSGPYQSMMQMGVEVYATESGESVARWEGELPWSVREAAVSTTGAVVVLYLRDLYAIDTNASDSKPVKRQNTSSRHFTSVAFSHDGTRFATTSNDTTATVWDAATCAVQRSYEWQIGRLRTVTFAPDGLRCVAGSDTGQVVVWDVDA